jgi:hypothetical protein
MGNEEKLPLPEKIVFIDGLTNQIRQEEAFEDVPESIRFAPNAQGELEPVVKIVDVTTDTQRIIRQFGRDDVVLRSTVQFLDE